MSARPRAGRRVLPALAVAAAWSVVGVALSGLTRTAYTLLLSNTRGPATTGEVGAQIALALLATMLWPAATGSAASKFVARAHGAGDPGLAVAVARHLGRRTLLTGAGVATAALVAAVVVYREPLATAVAVLPLVLGFSAYLLTRGVLLGAGRVAEATRWELLALVVSLSGLALLLATGAGTWLVLPLALGYLAYALAGARGARGGPRAPAVEPALRREMDAFVAWGVLGNVASAGLLQLCLVVARGTQPAADVGLLTVAVSLATPASMLARSLVQVLFPAMARSLAAGDAATVRRQTDVVTRGITAVFVPGFAVLVLAADALVRLAGEDFEDPTALRVLLVAVLLTTLPVAAVASMTSGTGDGIRRSALMSSAGLGVGVIGLVVVSWTSGGIVGIAVAYLAGAAATSTLPYVWVWRAQRQRWGWLTARIVVAAAAVGPAVVAAERAAGPSWAGPAAVAVVYLVCWTGASWGDVRRLTGSASPTP